MRRRRQRTVFICDVFSLSLTGMNNGLMGLYIEFMVWYSLRYGSKNSFDCEYMS